MIDLYYWTTPNGHKITMFLEEAGTPCTIKPVNVSKDDRFNPEFLSVSPNTASPPSSNLLPTPATISDARSRQGPFGRTASAVR